MPTKYYVICTVAKPHILVYCLLCSACSVYFHVFSCKEREHCSLRGKRGLIFNIATMLLKVLQIQSSVGEREIISSETFCIYSLKRMYELLYHFQTIRWKSSTWSRSIRFPSLVPRPHPRGESLVTFGQSFGFYYFLGRIFHLPKTPLVVATLETHDSSFFSKISYQFSTASYEFLMKPEVSTKFHLVGGVLVHGWLHCFVLL